MHSAYLGRRLGTDSEGPWSSRVNHDEPSQKAYKRDPGTTEQVAAASQQLSHRSSNATSRSPTTPNQVHWPTVAGAQPDTSGYVQPSPLYKQHHGSFSSHLSPYWSGYNHMDMGPYQPGSDNQGQTSNLDSPSIYVQESEPEASFSSAYHSFNQWNPGYTEDTGLT